MTHLSDFINQYPSSFNRTEIRRLINQMREIYGTKNPCISLFLITSISIILVVVVTKGTSNGLTLFSLPSSPWSWTPAVSRFHRPSFPPAPGREAGKRSIINDEKLKRVEAILAGARAQIKEALINGTNIISSPLQDQDYIPKGDIYRNPYAFHRSYLLMEKLFKIYVYEEGEPPIFHNGPSKSIYSIEGIFIGSIEKDTMFRTRDPDKAHVYYLPFSVVMIVEMLFDPVVRDKAVLERTVGGYVNLVSSKYPFWNRSFGADHFMLSCHDWGPRATWYVPQLYFTSIRALCNANSSERFNPRKDVSIPEINLQTGEISGLTGGLPPLGRTVLAFFAGRAHGRIRPSLLKHWKEKDDDVRVYESLPEGMSYKEMMRKSKFCICPSGWEVASPRIVEAIYSECVPVLISQKYVLPFSDVLDWDAFSVQVSVEEIPELKKILMGISDDKYLKMQENVRRVQRHFVVNDPPKRYDVFSMILHSIWLRRLNLLLLDKNK